MTTLSNSTNFNLETDSVYALSLPDSDKNSDAKNFVISVPRFSNFDMPFDLKIGSEIIIKNGKLTSKYELFSDKEINKKIANLKSKIDVNSTDNKQQLLQLSKSIFSALETNRNNSKDTISPKIFKDKVGRLENVSNVSKSHRLMAFLSMTSIALGIGCLTVGFGSLMSLLPIPAFLAAAGVATLGIPGIPVGVGIAILGIGIAITAAYIGTKIYANRNPDSYVAKVLQAANLMIRKTYLFSNLNDCTSSATYLFAIAVVVGAMVSVACPVTAPVLVPVISVMLVMKFVFGFITGTLMFGSGFQNFYESIKDLGISLANKDLLNKNWYNLINAVAEITMGFMFVSGLEITPFGVAGNLFLVFMPYFVNVRNIYKTFNDLKNTLKCLDTKDLSHLESMFLKFAKLFSKDLGEEGEQSSDAALKKAKFLRDSIKPTKEEIDNLSDKISKYTKEDICKWIVANTSKKQRIKDKYFNCNISSLLNGLNDFHLNKLNNEQLLILILEKLKTDESISESQLEILKKMIIDKETATLTTKKILSFGDKLNLSTLKEVIELNREDYSNTDGKVNALFNKVKKETKNKLAAEVGKFVLNTTFVGMSIAGLAFAPALATPAGIIAYGTANIALNTINTGFNSKSVFRNTPMSWDEEFEINHDEMLDITKRFLTGQSNKANSLDSQTDIKEYSKFNSIPSEEKYATISYS